MSRHEAPCHDMSTLIALKLHFFTFLPTVLGFSSLSEIKVRKGFSLQFSYIGVNLAIRNQ